MQQAMLAQSLRHALSSRPQFKALQKQAQLFVAPPKTMRAKHTAAVRNDIAALGASLLQSHFEQQPAADTADIAATTTADTTAIAAATASSASSDNSTSAAAALAALLPAPLPAADTVAAEAPAPAFSVQQLQQQQAVLLQCEADLAALHKNEVLLVKQTAVKGSRELGALCSALYDVVSAEVLLSEHLLSQLVRCSNVC
jgi:hypothetical protein